MCRLKLGCFLEDVSSRTGHMANRVEGVHGRTGIGQRAYIHRRWDSGSLSIEVCWCAAVAVVEEEVGIKLQGLCWCGDCVVE